MLLKMREYLLIFIRSTSKSRLCRQ